MVEYGADSRRAEIEDIGVGRWMGYFSGRWVVVSFCHSVVRSLGR